MIYKTILCQALTVFLALPYAQAEVINLKDRNGFVKGYFDDRKPHEAVVLTWQKSANGYGRDVQAKLVQTENNLNRLPTENLAAIWEKIISRGSFQVLQQETLAHSAQAAFNQPFQNAQIAQSVALLQGGANYFTDKSVADVIADKKLTIANFDRKTNIEITKKYGSDFSARLYKALLFKEQGTYEAMNYFTETLDKNLQKDEVKFDGSFELWVAKGFMQNTEDVHKVKGMFEKVLAMMSDAGLPVHTFKTKTADPVQTNAEIIANQIRESSRNGKKFALLAISKAVPETLGALALLNQEGFFDNEKNSDLIKGIILTAGPEQGMHFADFASKPIVFSIIKSKMKDMAASNKVDITNLQAGLKSVSHSQLGSYYDAITPYLPKLFYINLIGVSKSGTGYAEYKPLRDMQEGLFNRWFFPNHGANDGIVEYSSLMKTSRLGEKAVTLVADGDHCIFPCKFQGKIVDSNPEQMRSFSALFEFMDKYKVQIGRCESIL